MRSKDVPVTREMVYQWLTEYQNSRSNMPIKAFLASKLNGLNLAGIMVDTREHDDRTDETSLLTMIVEDIASYGFPVS